MEKLYPFLLRICLGTGILVCLPLYHIAQDIDTTELQSIFLPEKDTTEFTFTRTIERDFRPGFIESGNGNYIYIYNLKYDHNIQVYNSEHNLVHTIDNSVYSQPDLTMLDYQKGRGTPVQGVLTHNDKYLWSIHYQKYGSGFVKPGINKCEDSQNYKQGFLSKINTETQQLEYKSVVGKVPEYITASPDDQRLVVSNSCSQDLYIFDLQTDSLLRIIELPDTPGDVAIDHQSKYVYIAHTATSRVSRVNLESYVLSIFMLEPNSSPMNLVCSPDNHELYVSLSASGQLAKYRTRDDTLLHVQSIQTGRAPRALTISHDGKYIFVANYLSHSVVKIRTADLTTTGKVTTGPNPMSLCWQPSTSLLYIASFGTNAISVYQLSQPSVFPSPDPFGPKQSTIEQLPTETSRLRQDSLTSADPSTLPPDTFNSISQVQHRNLSSKRENPFSEDGVFIQEPFPTTEDSTYALILGSFKEIDNAKLLIANLDEKGISTQLLSGEPDLYRVSYGSFSTLNQARASRIQLMKDLEISIWIKSF